MSEKRFATPENGQPSYDAVFSDMSNKRQELQVQLAEVGSRPGFKLDAIEMMEKRREERRLRQELAAHENEWNSYGGEAVDRAQAQVDELSFKSDASERVSAQLALRDAKNDFYQKYLDAHPVKESESELADTSASANEAAVKGDAVTSPDASAQDAAIEASEVTNPDASAHDAIMEDDAVTSPDAPAQDAVVEGAEVTEPDAPAHDAVIEQESTADIERIDAELASARSDWAKISSKRQRRTFDRRIKGYKDARDRYNQLVQERGRALLADELAQTDSVTEKNALVIAYLANEQNELRELVKHESDMKFPVRFANWMNRGSRKARLAKGLAIGLAAGVGGSFLAGAAGVGILAGGAVAASRFVRGYTARHTEGMGQLDETSVAREANHRAKVIGGDNIESLSGIFQGYFEVDSKREQIKRRKAVAWGVGSIAVGSIAGHALHLGIDHVSGWTEHNGLGGHLFTDHQSNHPMSGGDHTPPSGGGHDTAPSPSPKLELHELANAHDTFNVHPGEGWYETMKDMGIPEDKWADVLKDAGPKLHEQGWAYFDTAHHEWRITKPGHLSGAAVQALKNASAQHGFSFR